MAEAELIALEPNIDQLEEIVIPLCKEILPGVTSEYLLDRLELIRRPRLILAKSENRVVGFKLGYGLSNSTFQSWLGGVLPDYRRNGIASSLMIEQHEVAKGDGYGHIETRSRATNSPMIILNLRHGFQLIGFEIDSRGVPVVLLRKALGD